MERFSTTGTRDDAPYTAVADALAYRQALGGEEKILSYIHELALWGQRHLQTAWNVSSIAPESMVGGMANVVVPTRDANSTDECLAATCGLLSRWGILVNVEPPGTYGQERCVIRMCAQVYLEKSDFVSVGEKVLRLIAEAQAKVAKKEAEELAKKEANKGLIKALKHEKVVSRGVSMFPASRMAEAAS